MPKSATLKSRLILGMTLICWASRFVYGCAHPWPNSMLDGGDLEALQAPVTMFKTEIDSLLKNHLPEFKAKSILFDADHVQSKRNYGEETEQADVHDLRAALSGLGSQDVEEKIKEYEMIRSAISSFRSRKSAWKDMQETNRFHQRYNWKVSEVQLEQWREHGIDLKDTDPPKLSVSSPLPAWLPQEFSMYLRGAIHYHQDQRGKAQNEWSDLMRLPKDERLYRSIWAAFMIGKCLLEDDPSQSVPWFQRVRELKKGGFKDRLGLADASLGWEAQAELRLKNYERALDLYFAKYQASNTASLSDWERALPSTRALVSLCWTCSKALASGPKVLQRVATNEMARKIVTAYILSHGQPRLVMNIDEQDGKRKWVRMNPSQKWAQAIEAANVASVEEAGRFAWVAYQGGEYELAKQWLDIAPADGTMTRWIRAKLLLRKGKVKKAAKHLSFLTSKIPPNNKLEGGDWYHSGSWSGESSFELSDEPAKDRIRGELGLLKLSRDDYIGALHALLLGQYQYDAAYIAQRILTVDELKQYVDKNWKDHKENRGSFMRGVLGRRLMRMGKWKEARPYFWPKARSTLDEYVAAIRKGHDERLPERKRAAAFWRAAEMARFTARDLMSVHTEPQWYSSAYPAEKIKGPKVREVRKGSKFLKVTAKERRRTVKHLPELRRDLYYRYVALDHAWKATELMPDNDETTAKMLCAAGDWVKHQDPKSADRFYKALAIRCRRTQLGEQAYALHWFPKVKIDEAEIREKLSIKQ